jgi:hypothetical protein
MVFLKRKIKKSKNPNNIPDFQNCFSAEITNFPVLGSSETEIEPYKMIIFQQSVKN